MKNITSNLVLLFILIISSILTFAQSTAKKQIKSTISTADSFFQAQNWAMARQAYEEVLTDTSTNAMAWNRLGFTYYHLKMNNAALSCFKKSISQNPPIALKGIVYSRMAKIHALVNEKRTVFTELDSAVSLGYNNVADLDTSSAYTLIRADPYFTHLRDQVYLNANPCMGNAHAREFDFWVGEWNVYQTGTKAVVGHSLIQIISGGCALLENWESAASNGKSINFIDPLTNKWKQSWAGNYLNGVQEFVNGEYKDSAMRFTFETINPQGKKIVGRFIFFNQGPGQVRQFNETSVDGGKTWTTNYDFTYIKK